jgi:predicted metalloprotease with PDZ domain
MCLDIELRVRSGGKKSLDDVVMVLWKQCRNDQPGFPEDGIRKALVQVGGTEMGGVYDSLVMKPGELPVEAELAKMGIQLIMAAQYITYVGFDARPGQTGVRVRRERSATDLKERDVLTDLNGTALTGATAFGEFRKIADAAKPGDKLMVKYRRGDADGTAIVSVVKATRDAYRVLTGPVQSAEIERIREGWYRAGKKAIPTGS